MTAVEWLQSGLELIMSHEEQMQAIGLFEQAKEMEKEQIVEARNNGFLASGEGWNGEYGIEDINNLTQEIKSEEYYKETFK